MSIALLPKQVLFMARQSIFIHCANAFLALFFISIISSTLSRSASCEICHSHLIFHITLDASDTIILKNLFASLLCLLAFLFITMQPSCFPRLDFLKCTFRQLLGLILSILLRCAPSIPLYCHIVCILISVSNLRYFPSSFPLCICYALFFI